MSSTREWLLRTLLAAAAGILACSRTPSAPTGTDAPQTPAGTVTISGTVRDSLPSGDGAPVPGAQVQVAYKVGAGGSATSGTDGSYRIDGVSRGAFFQLRTSKDGYETGLRKLSPLTADSTIDLPLAPIPSTLTGVVTETPPTESTPIAEAKLEILTGSNAGRTTTTDRAGAYVLSAVWGDFDLSVSAAEHEPQTVHVSGGASPRLDVRLKPREARLHTGLTGDLCTTVRLPPWLACTQPFERTHTIAVRRPGALTLNVDYRYVGDYYQNSLSLEVRCGSVVVLEKRFMKLWEAPPTVLPDGVTGAIRLPAAQPCTYELRLFNFIADTKGGHQTTYQVGVDYPR